MRLIERGSRVAFRISGTEIVGRGYGATLQLALRDLSRRHCRLTVLPNNVLRVEDLGSLNGTFINDEPVNEALAYVGDVISFGRGLHLLVAVGATTEGGDQLPDCIPGIPLSQRVVAL